MARISAGLGPRVIALLSVVAVCVVSSSAPVRAADAPTKPSRATTKVKTPANTVELFDGMKSGDIEVKLIASDATKGNVIVTNKTKQPISVKLPKAFAGVPVLAQQFPFNGGNRNFANNGNTSGVIGGNGMNQAMGGGFTQGINGGNNFNRNGMNPAMNFQPNGIMNIPPEKIAKVRVPLVCLEHGKDDPRASIPYEIKPIETVTGNVAVQQLCAMLGEGKVGQRVAQVAAWHLANGLSYDELAAKQLEEFGSPARPYFTSQELKDAKTVVEQAEDQAEEIEKEATQNIAQTSTGDSLDSTATTVTTAAVVEKSAIRRKTRSR